MRPNTVAAYQADLDRYADYLGGLGVDRLASVSEDMISGFLAALRQDRVAGGAGLSASSAGRAVVTVRGLHRFATREGWTTVDPAACVTPPRIPLRLPHAIPYDDVMAMIAAAGAGGSPRATRDQALLELLYGTGLRISEAMALDVDDLGRDVDTLLVTGKGGKQRMLPVGRYAREAVSAYLVRGRPTLAAAGRGTPALFLNQRGGRLSRQSAWQLLRDAAARAGVADPVSPHTMRHSFATHLLDGGADVRVVQELLGHASVATTQIYTLVTVDQLREVYALAHPRARG